MHRSRDEKRWTIIEKQEKESEALQLKFSALKWTEAISEESFLERSTAWNCVKMIKVDETDPVGGESGFFVNVLMAFEATTAELENWDGFETMFFPSSSECTIVFMSEKVWGENEN